MVYDLISVQVLRVDRSKSVDDCVPSRTKYQSEIICKLLTDLHISLVLSLLERLAVESHTYVYMYFRVCVYSYVYTLCILYRIILVRGK